jgi:hypothetical protein
VSTDLRPSETQGALRALRVEAVFQVTDDRQAQVVASRMIDRAHEIANLPECECDVDVSVELARPAHASDPGDPAGAPAPGSPVKH